jgi:hypothetical protein
MTADERAAYMREYRKRRPSPKKRVPLDRSKPETHLYKTDPSEYWRRHMRARRAKYATAPQECPTIASD